MLESIKLFFKVKNGDLKTCPICSGLEVEDELAFMEDMNCVFKAYNKGDLIVNQGDPVDALYMLTIGSVKTEMVSEDGNVLNIENIVSPRPLAPAFLFSDNNRFPVNVYALEEVEVIKIPKLEIIKLMQTNPTFMQKYLTHNANRTQFLSNRLQMLCIKSIKGKIAHYLLEHCKEVNKSFKVDKNQSELAEYFGVARPSLARSLSEMVEESVIFMQRKEFKILDLNKIKELL